MVLESINTNDWSTIIANGGRTFAAGLNVQTSAGECGGDNDEIQTGRAVITVCVPFGESYTMDWVMNATVESQDEGFDYAKVTLDLVEIGRADSAGTLGGCEPLDVNSSGAVVLTSGVHTIEVVYDTVDTLFHTNEFGVFFSATLTQI